MPARRLVRPPSTRPPVSRAARLASGAVATAAAALTVGVLSAGASHDTARDPGAGRGDRRGHGSAPDGSLPSGGPTGHARRAACEVPVLRRDTLRDAQGRPFFLVPDAMASRDGHLLIAGHRSVRLDTDARGTATGGEQDAVLASLRTADGTHRTFSRPDDLGHVDLEPVRAAALPGGRWAVLLTDRSGSLENAVALRTWLAVLGPDGWEEVRPLAPPPGVRILAGAGAPLQVDGERLLAALPAIRNDDDFGAVLLEGTPTRPTLRFHPLPGAAYTAAAFATAAHEPALFAVHPDPDAPGSGNTLFLHFPDRLAVAPRALTNGTLEALHAPSALRVADGFRVTAMAQSRANRSAPARAVHLFVPDTGAPVPELHAADAVRATSVIEADGAVLVIHSQSDTAGPPVVQLHRFPGPGRGMRVPVTPTRGEILGAVRDGASDLVIASLLGGVDQAIAPSLALTWISPQCQATSGRETAR
jgi:hypothetical protein